MQVKGSYEVTSVRPVGARRGPDHPADGSRTRHTAVASQREGQTERQGPDLVILP
jgi:hypothetical protein